jgi:hypothetical protein
MGKEAGRLVKADISFIPKVVEDANHKRTYRNES